FGLTGRRAGRARMGPHIQEFSANGYSAGRANGSRWHVDRTFQVDLRGIVDLLSHHLYSSPRVYVRELLQNAVDAITARRAVDPDAPTTITIDTSPGRLVVSDTGIGLTETQAHELPATVG